MPDTSTAKPLGLLKLAAVPVPSVSLSVPDKNGKPTDVVLGYDNIAQYADTARTPSDYGSSVGRYANRIKNAQIVVEGKTYKLRANDMMNCLHGGGNTGWLHKIYDVKSKNDSSVVFEITAKDGENGFPGTVKATATYTVKSNKLFIAYIACDDKLIFCQSCFFCDIF